VGIICLRRKKCNRRSKSLSLTGGKFLFDTTLHFLEKKKSQKLQVTQGKTENTLNTETCTKIVENTVIICMAFLVVHKNSKHKE
jgi:hypothetical protein